MNQYYGYFIDSIYCLFLGQVGWHELIYWPNRNSRVEDFKKNGWFRKEIPNLETLRQIVINIKLLLYNFIIKMILILMYLNIQIVDQSQCNCML